MLACKCECVCVWVSVGACVWVSECVRACSCVRVHTCSACVDLIVVVAGIMACSWLPNDRASLCWYNPLQLLFPLSPFPSPSLLFCFAFIPSLSLAVVPAKASKKYVTSSGQEPSISCHLPRPPWCLLAAPPPPLEALYVTLSAFACCFLYVNSLLAFYSHMRSFSLFIVYLNRLRIHRMCCCFSGISAMWRTYVLWPRLQLMTVANWNRWKQVRKWYTRQRDRKREGKEAIKAIKIVEQLRRIEAHKSRKRSWESWRR